jgi:hypothetical protein
MSTPKLHHYLSRFYLEGFTRDEMLSVFDRKSNEYRTQHPLTTAAIRHFYAIETDDGKRDIEVELHLGKIEGKAQPIIAALDRGDSITPEDRVYLSYFLGLLHSRVPKFEREMTEVADQAIKAILKRMFPNEEVAASHLRRRGRDGDISAAAVVDFVQNERFSVKGNRNNAIDTMLHQAPDLAKLFNIMDWMVAHADPRTSFITTDSPFALLVSDELRQSGKPVFGVGSFEIVKAVPLTSRTCLLMGGKGVRFGHVDFNRDSVRDINLQLAREADRFVIAADEAHLRSIVRRTRIDRERTGTRMRVDHVQHPSDPNRTFIISRRVPIDGPDEPLKIVVE